LRRLQSKVEAAHSKLRPSSRSGPRAYTPEDILGYIQQLQQTLRSLDSVSGPSAVPTDEQSLPVKSIYMSRPAPKTSSLGNQRVVLERQLRHWTNLLEITQRDEDGRFQDSSRVSEHRYVPRRYMARTHRRADIRPHMIVDFSKFRRTEGECQLCLQDSMSLYTYACCNGASVCGPCANKWDDRCPFCRAQDISFVEARRSDCRSNECVDSVTGRFDSLVACNAGCVSVGERRTWDKI
jgi:hypothetical protein